MRNVDFQDQNTHATANFKPRLTTRPKVKDIRWTDQACPQSKDGAARCEREGGEVIWQWGWDADVRCREVGGWLGGAR